MVNFTVYALAALTLASQIAAVRITYSCKHNGGLGNSAFETKNAGEIDDAVGNNIVANMGAWSNNRYTATLRNPLNLITVKLDPNTPAVAGKAQALDEIANMEDVVRQNT